MIASVGTPVEKINIVSNDHGQTENYDFSVLDQKYTF